VSSSPGRGTSGSDASRGAPGSDWDAPRAVAYLLRLLARRDYTRAELDERLRRKGVPDPVREAALVRLSELALLDDRRVAEGHVRGRAHRKGRRALRRELERRGVAEPLRDEVLAPLDDAQQLAAARGVLAKHAWRFASGDLRKDRAKASAFLARRGFAGDTVRSAVDTAFDSAFDTAFDEAFEGEGTEADDLA